jgi:carbon-monoxide dehydrogenase small subunit
MSDTIEKVSVRIDVNGHAYEHTIEPRLLLVDYLRNVLRLTGTHIGCDTSSCGACTVLLGDRCVKSCTMLAVQGDGQAITTVEGLAAMDGTLHALQQGFHEAHGLQCGYCTPGMLLAAADLLKHNSQPDERAIRRAIAGNICRCTGYQNIVKAIQFAGAELSKEKMKEAP